MKARNKFAVLLLVMFAIAAAYYFLSTDRTSDMVLIGTVDANQVIVSAKIQGRIEKLLVDEGTPVKAGDLIAQLDDAELLAQKTEAEATLASSRSRVGESHYTEQATRGFTNSDVSTAQSRVQSTRAQLDEAQAALSQQKLDTERIVALADQGVASQQDRDRATYALKQAQARVQSLREQVRATESDLASTRARVNQATAAVNTVAAVRAQARTAQAQIAETEARLGYTRIYAPVTGLVSVRAAREGEVVTPGQPIVTIVDLNDTWVRAAIPETYGEKIAIGDSLPVRYPSGAKVDGRVIFKGVESDFATQRDVSRTKRDIKTQALKLQVDNSRQTLVPGMTAEVLVPKKMLNRSTAQAQAPAPRQPVAER